MTTEKTIVSTDFCFNPDKEKALAAIQCYPDSPAYGEMSKLYDQLVEEAAIAITPKAAFRLDKKQERFACAEVSGCDKLVYCLVTLGHAIAAKSGEYFKAGLYAEGLIIDAIANNVLFDCAGQLHGKIAGAAKADGLGLTRRLTPGEGSLAIACQKAIVELFKEESSLAVSVTQGYMLDPVKSLAYVYGAGENLPPNFVDHDCSLCGQADCAMKAVPALSSGNRPDAAMLTSLEGE